MLQMLGACLLILGSIGIGYLYIQEEIKIIHVIETWEHIMQMFISEITYKKQPLDLACYEIGEKIGNDEGECLNRISLLMQKNERLCFKEIWEQEWCGYCEKKKMKTDLKQLIKEFGVLTGFEDEMIQKRMIEEQKEKWKSKRVILLKEHRERKRIVLLLSSCLGIVMVLILW